MPLPDGFEGPDAADAEQDLLADPVLGAAPVQAVRYRSQLVGVLVHVGVEQVELDPSHLAPTRSGR